MRIRHCLRTALAFGALLASALSGAEPFAYVSNHDGNSVMAIDLATNMVVATVPFAGTHTLPHAMAIHTGTGRLYVLRENMGTDPFGNVDNAPAGGFGDGGPGWVIDTTTNSLIDTLPVLGNSVVVNPVGSRLYISPGCNNCGLYVIDTATDAIDGDPIPGPYVEGLAITPDGSRLYAAGLYGVRVFDTSTRAQVGTIDVHDSLVDIAINAAGTRAYAVSDAFIESPVMAVIDITTNTVMTKVSLAAPATNVAVNPAGTRVYVTEQNTGSVEVFDATNNAFLGTIPVGTRPMGVSFDSSGSRAYVANFGSNTVSVIDVATSTVTATIPVGMGPMGIVVSRSAPTPTVTLGSSVNPSTFGQQVDLTATVSGSSGTPTGTIVFQDSGMTISGCAGVAMTNGSAICRSSTLGSGTHSIIAVYSGDGTYNGASSTPLQQTVNGTTPTVNLASSRNPSVVGTMVTFTAAVTGSQGTATGKVNFLDGASSIAGCSAVALSAGSAACSSWDLALGTHSITAAYLGGGPYDAATSGALSQVMNPKQTPSITLGSTANPSTVGQYVTYTGVVSGSMGTPIGTIVFRDNGVVINGCGGLSMTNGRATCTIGNQAQGTHSMTAVYSGDSFYDGITSSTLPQVVNPAKPNTPSITLGSSVNPSTVGQYVELTAVVFGGAGTPTGTLVFLDNGDAISGCGGLTMAGGQATCTPGSLTQGTHSITTVYSGDSTYNGVTSSTLPQTVDPAKANTPSFTLGTSQNPSLAGNRVTFTAMLSGAAGTVTGNVVFRDNGLTIAGCGGIALTNGSVTCTPALNTMGTHSITGIYLGDSNYNGITSSVLPQTVQ